MNRASEIKRAIVKDNKIPVDISLVAEREGLSIAYFNPAQMDGSDLEGVSGLLNKAKKIIYINSTDSPERQRFTLAHELGHFVYDHSEDKLGLNYRDPKGVVSSAERQANDFAAEALVPSPVLRRKLKEYAKAKPSMKEVAQMFGVSVEAMRIRVDNIGLNSLVSDR